MQLTDLIGNMPTVVLLGMCKNAGKTTALNRIIRESAAAEAGVIALTSIGRDGESLDLVTGTEKPPIYVYAGMLCATAEGLLPLCDVSRELLALTDLHTPLGRIVIFRARSDGLVQLAGPSIVEQLDPLRRELEALGARRVLIDGALSRRSPASFGSDGACVLSTGASLDRDLDRVVAETTFAVRLLMLPEAPRPGEELDRFTLFRTGEAVGSGSIEALCAQLKRGRGGDVLLSGALTDSQAGTLLRSGAALGGLRLIAGDGSRYLLKRESFLKLEALGVQFAVLRATYLAAVTVNPVSAGGWRFDASEFRGKLREKLPVPVLDVEAEHGSEL